MDKTENKIRRLNESCKKHHLNNISTFVFDATKAFDNTEGKRDPLKGPPYGENTFDSILLDAPCSALGQRPQLCHSVPVKQLNSFPLLQKRLLKTVSL